MKRIGVKYKTHHTTSLRFEVDKEDAGVGEGDPKRERALAAEDPLPRRHHARHLRAAGLHLPAGGFGAASAGQPGASPWCQGNAGRVSEYRLPT